MGWGPSPATSYSWDGLDFTNIDLFIPQCYGSDGITYTSNSTSSPEEICKYWVNGGPVGNRPNFTPCKVPANKLAAGLGSNGGNPVNAYTADVKKYAKAGYIIWGSKWDVDWNKCK